MRLRIALFFCLAGRMAASVDFATEIKPLLDQRCIACHGEKIHLSGLRFDDKDSAARVIVPGKPAESKILAKVKGESGGVMPPAGPKLTADQIAKLTKWIEEGAVWPSSASRPRHWAWEAAKRTAPPVISKTDWPANEIDRFVLARLEKEKVVPSPDADKRTLLRRVSLDLTGLPPTPAETAAFLADTSSSAYEKVVDRLLGSQHYGEKWARYWLDLAHYADSDGYEKDLVRDWAWRYRDWVISAYNRDLPYDQFITEQIAGDELPNATVDQRIATGFYRNTLTNREAGVDRKEARFEQLIDRTATTGTVFLGLTVRCAQCHDHKYDPISQKDFYRIEAYFHGSDEVNIDAPLPGELGPYLRSKPEYEKKRAALLAEYNIAALQAKWEDIIRGAMTKPGVDLDWDFQVTEIRAGVDHAERVLFTEPAKRLPKDALRIQNRFLRNAGPLFKGDKPAADKFKEFQTKLAEVEKLQVPVAEAPVMEDRPENGPAYIALRGDYKAVGASVEPGAPSFLPAANVPMPRRLDFAKWLLREDNPLTARVAVNRLWQELFGRGIVSTSEDFGTQGDKPSHPELLDWLATEYRRVGWSQKAMLKEIVMSRTYRQSSATRKDLETKDPENILLARQGRLRLPAELLRDEALTVSGLLDEDIGGRSIKPFQPAGVAELGYSVKKWVESPGRDKYRRGLYIHYQRTTPYPFLVNFDVSDSTLACTRRRVSNTPLQAMNLLNDPVFFEAAQALAYRTEAAPLFADRLQAAFTLALNRVPTEKETARLAKYYDQQAGISAREPGGVPAWVAVCRVILNLDEFITRE